MVLPRSPNLPEMELEWMVPEKSNAIERDRARTYHQAYSALIALHNLERAHARRCRPGAPRAGTRSRCRTTRSACGFHEAARGVLSHHMVIRDGKIANYQPYPPTPWNASPRDVYGTPGPYEDAVQNTPIFEENGPENFKGIDIMRAVRSLRPVPAVRRAHVHRRREGAEGRCTRRRRSRRRSGMPKRKQGSFGQELVDRVRS